MIRQFVRFNRSGAQALAQHWPRLFGGEGYNSILRQTVQRAIIAHSSAIVLEVGGADRPLLGKSAGYRYIGLDIDGRPECHAAYDELIVQSVEEPIGQRVDMIVSTTLLEHVQDNRAALRSMFHALKDEGGYMYHYVPSKWHPYSILLQVVGPAWQKRLIATLRPDAAAVTGYPAYFHHCSPVQMRNLLSELGFTQVELRPFYRAADYFAFLLPAFVIVAMFENICRRLRLVGCAAGFIVSARKEPR